MRWKKYDKAAAHAYAFGVFPTLELLRYQHQRVIEVLLHSQGERNEGLDKVRALCDHTRIPVTVDNKLIERLTPKENTYAIGIFQKYYPHLDPQADHLVLVQPGDMGNLGTTIRTLLGFGRHNLALIRPAVDIFDPRVVRASMGAVFQLAFTYFDSFDFYRTAFDRHHLYPFMTDGAADLPAVTFEPPFTLVFGSESSGLPSEFHAAGTSVRIPQQPTIDSLNLSVAIGIALYAAMK
ncbi:MAG TPA: TrmH family RNA methyltransferase [Phototrophicaceae bacterium]|nr:TrmH family RNA methyltransferase [Phototrophicaceae bacterium]